MIEVKRYGNMFSTLLHKLHSPSREMSHNWRSQHFSHVGRCLQNERRISSDASVDNRQHLFHRDKVKSRYGVSAPVCFGEHLTRVNETELFVSGLNHATSLTDNSNLFFQPSRTGVSGTHCCAQSKFPSLHRMRRFAPAPC